MPTLSSLIVQREIATMRTVEEAIARQVLHGGDLATNLLELAGVREEALIWVVAEGYGLEPAPVGKLPAPDAATLKRIPGELALRHSIFPLSGDRTLVIAVSEPLAPAVEEDLSFALDVNLRQLCSPLVRIRQALAEHYGLALDRRLLRLIARLDGRADPSPSSMPPALRGPGPIHLPRPASVPPTTFGTGAVASPRYATVTITGDPGARAASPVTTRGTPVVGSAPPEALPDIPRAPQAPTFGARPGRPEPASSPGARRAGGRGPITLDWMTPVGPEMAAQLLAEHTAAQRGEAEVPAAGRPDAPTKTARAPASPSDLAGEPWTGAEPPAERVERTPTQTTASADLPAPPPSDPVEEAGAPRGSASAGKTRALGGWLRRALVDERKGEGRAPRRKGPFTAAMAEAELEDETTTEGVLDVFFDFAQQFFEYSVLFSVQGDLAEGRDAAGPGADRARVAGIGVPLDLPSALATARDRRAALCVRLDADGLDAELRADLGRAATATSGAPGRPPVVAVVPVVLRSRTIALLYGDDGAADVELSSLGDVISLAGLCSAVLERVILRKKLGAFRPGESDSRSARAPGVRAPLAATTRSARTGIWSPRPRHRGGAAALAKALALPRPPADEEGQQEQGDTRNAAGGDALPRVSSGAESVRMRAPPAAPAESFGSISPAAGSDRPGAPAPPPGTALTDEDSGESLNRAISRMMETPSASAAGLLPDKSRPITEADLVEAGWGAHAVSFDTPGPVGVAPASEPRAPGSSPRADTKPPTPGSDASSQRRGPAPTFAARPRQSAERPLERSDPTNQPPNAISRSLGPDSDRTPRPFKSLPSDAPPPPTAAARRPLSRAIPREDEDVHERETRGAEVVSAFATTVIGDGTRTRSDPPVAGGARTGKPVPSVIIDVDAEYASLIERVVQGAADSNAAFAELVKHGEQSMPAIINNFPGPLRVDRHRARSELPAASQCGPILELTVAIRRTALPFVTVRCASPDPEIRFWATHVLGELRYPESANVLVPRLFDDDVSVRRIARRSAAALVNAGESGQPIVQGLDHLTRNPDEAKTRRVLGIETMGEMRSGPLVPSLIAVLGDPSEDLADAARRALLLITRQDLGRDTAKWTEWWAKNADRHRVEWLVDALMHDVAAIRRAAGDELKQLTKEYFGYYDDLPRKERERAQGRYREWWEKEGRARFR